MAKFKMVIAEEARSKSIEVDEEKARLLIGLKIGDVIDGKPFGVKGKIRITGGSDKAGFPMRADVHGGVKKYVLLSNKPGFKPKNKGERRRKLVRGNMITDEIYQINAVVVK
jgi:small subunit ribosomal protein S6e